MPEQLPKWQAIGTEPTIELQTNGWQPGMKPSAQHMNWLFNRAYKCLEDLQNNKVDKVNGKGLSTNDYTTAEKTKLANIAAGATKTIVNNTLTSASTTDALSAAQGKVLKDLVDSKASNTDLTQLRDDFTAHMADTKEEIELLSKVPVDRSQNNGVPASFFNFKRKSAYRNFYNSKFMLNKLSFGYGNNLSESLTSGGYHGGNLNPVHQFDGANPLIHSYNNEKLTISNDSSVDSEESLIEIGKLYPFATFEIGVSDWTSVSGFATSVLSIYEKDNIANRSFLNVRHNSSGGNSITFEKYNNGVFVETITLMSSIFTEKNYTIKMQLTNTSLVFYLTKESGETSLLGKVPVSDVYDLTKKDVLNKFRVGFGARIASGKSITFNKAESYYSCGIGQSDNYLITYEDRTPIINGNKAYVSMTTRTLVNSFCGIYELDLTTLETKIVGALFFEDVSDSATLRHYVATSITYNRKTQEFIVLPVNFGWGHSIQVGVTKKNILSGFNVVQTSQLNYPSINNEEDCTIYFNEDTQKWNFAMCRDANGLNNFAGYFLYQYEADDIFGELTLLNKHETATSFTGVNYVRIANKMYIACGKCWENATDGTVKDKFYLYDTSNLTQTGVFTIDKPLNSYNTWATIIPVFDGIRTKYLMMTFDRGNLFDTAYTYGSLYFYESDFEEDGYVYDFVINQNTMVL